MTRLNYAVIGFNMLTMEYQNFGKNSGMEFAEWRDSYYPRLAGESDSQYLTRYALDVLNA